MTYQQAIVPLIEDAYKDLFKNARRLSDKLDYKVSETNRTPLQMLQECATVAAGLVPILDARAMVGSESDWAEAEKQMASLTTIEACEAEYERNKTELLRAIADFPEERLEELIETPWGTFPWRDFIAYLYWNPMYHTGQLAYVQMIHGDAEMH